MNKLGQDRNPSSPHRRRCIDGEGDEMSDSVLDWMKKHLPPEQWTRKRYLTLAYLGNSPDEPLDSELEAEIPEEFQLPENQSGWGGEL